MRTEVFHADANAVREIIQRPHFVAGLIQLHIFLEIRKVTRRQHRHAVPGEPYYKGDPDRVKMTPIGDFYARGYAQAAAVMRPLDYEAGRRAARKALEVYRRGTRFDHDFDDRDTSAMYCTELVVHAYRAAGVELVGPERAGLKLPLVERRCILPSQVERSDELKRIYMFNP